MHSSIGVHHAGGATLKKQTCCRGNRTIYRVFISWSYSDRHVCSFILKSFLLLVTFGLLLIFHLKRFWNFPWVSCMCVSFHMGIQHWLNSISRHVMYKMGVCWLLEACELSPPGWSSLWRFVETVWPSAASCVLLVKAHHCCVKRSSWWDWYTWLSSTCGQTVGRWTVQVLLEENEVVLEPIFLWKLINSFFTQVNGWTYLALNRSY